MKKHLSVLMLFVRSAIFKALGLFAVMSAAEIFMFNRILKSVDLSQPRNVYADQTGQALEMILQDSKVSWVLFIAYLILTAILLKNCAGSGAKQVYTFQRLSVSERGVFGWQAVCNTGFYFLLWAVQCILIFAMCAMYMKTADASITSGQTVFLAFYRSKFIHCLMPLEQTGRLIRNIFTICGLGIASAYTSRAHRHDSRSFAIVVMSAGLLFFFVEINNTVNDGILIAMSIIMLIWTLTELRKEVPYEAE